MKKSTIFIVVIVCLLVLCLPVSVFASSEPVLASVMGAIMGNTSSAWYNLNISSFTPGSFSLRANNVYTEVTDIRLYFQVSVPFNSFEIVIIGKNSLNSISDGSFSRPVYISDYVNGSFTNTSTIQTSVQSSVSTNSDGYSVFKYQYSDSEISKNALMVTLPYNYTVMGNGVFYDFEIQTFALNGVNVDEFNVTKTNEDFSQAISSLSVDENEWWQRVVLPDYEQFLDDPDIIDGSNTYRQAIRSITFDNFLAPGMITLVFIMAFYGFLLYGKKG